MADSGAIFGKIVAGEIPCHRVYEDERVLAFLDIEPLAPGHTLVIPKRRSDTLDAMPQEDAAAIGRVLPRIARAVMSAVSGGDPASWSFNVLQNNGAPAHQAVSWVHFHIIPKPDGKRGLGIHWPATKLDAQQGAKLAERVRAAMEP